MKERLEELFSRYLRRESSEAEEAELMTLWMQPELESTKAALIDDAYDHLPDTFMMDDETADQLFSRILVRKAKVRRMHWKQIAVAASVLLLAGLGIYRMYFNKPATDHEVAATVPEDVKAPAMNRAVITLADGRVVYLDSAGNGPLASGNGYELVKEGDGRIVYSAQAGSGAALHYNTLTNPRGSRVIDMTLADGSRVWLNAGSSVRYPVAFTGNEREIEMNGEAYFEVAHDVSKPFKVRKGEMEVTVLGTHFNVNAYDDEAEIKVTLLEGSVRTAAGQERPVILQPGQQAQVGRQIRVVSNVDTEMVMAWKNGLFSFENAGIESLMRQIARWYDVDVAYQDKPTRIFRGSIPKDMSAANVFKALEETGGVHFKIEGRKVTVFK